MTFSSDEIFPSCGMHYTKVRVFVLICDVRCKLQTRLVGLIYILSIRDALVETG